MATTLTNTTFSTTYKDDFLDSDNYHRILFNSGKALQARELTQIQTFLQNQITRFGNNIFKEGAVVKPGGANLNQKYEFIKLNTTTNALPTDTSAFPGAIFTGATSGVQVKCIEVVTATGGDPATLYVQYLKTSSATASANTIRMTPGENISGAGATLTVQTTNSTANPAVGAGLQATLKSGIYYARGHFVHTEDQSKIISKYSDSKDTDIGFKTVEEIVTTSDDNDLFDNQGAVPDVSAPGADRYRIRLTIAERSEVDSDENFIAIAEIRNGLIYNAVGLTDAYNVPNKLIAERIKENSGDYIVKPFTINFAPDSSSTSHLQLRVSDGIVVVDGYRAARNSPTVIKLPKATTTVKLDNEVTPANFGNFVIVNPAVTAAPTGAGSTQGIPTLLSELELRDSASMHGGATDRKIGTARLKAIREDGAKLRYHLFDINMNSGKAFRNVKSIGADSNNYFNPELENNKCVLKDVPGNTGLFALPKPRPQTIEDIQLTVQRQFTATSAGGGNSVTINLSASGETFTNTGDWLVAAADSDIIQGLSVTGAGTQSSTITATTADHLPNSTSMKILAYVNKSSGTTKTKALATKTENFLIESDGGTVSPVTPGGNKFINLRQADVYAVDNIVLLSDSSELSDRFSVDLGQRASHYGLAKLNLHPKKAVPSGAVQVKYRYFTHTTNGDFFSANSYSGAVDYSKIPSFRAPTGNILNLRNMLDFRPVMDSDGNFTNVSSGARAIEQPEPTALITSDNTYFLGQAAKLVIDTEGRLKVINGVPGFTPQVPAKPDLSLSLYDLYLGANTLSSRDITATKINHKRFTMKDISQLEKRLDQVEELTSLTLLEHDTKNMQILDSAGNDRAKTGFVIDNFTDHSITNTNPRLGHRASLDPVQHRVRPMFSEDNIKLMYDDSASTNMIKKGDNIYIDYDEVLYVNQNIGTKAIVINPFAVVSYEGVLEISPSSDEWKDIERSNDKVVPGTTRISGVNAYNWDCWNWNWKGQSVEDLGLGSMTNELSGMVNRVIASESVMDVIDDRLVQSTLIPYIRARKVFFKATGLRPDTQHFMFFDGEPMAEFVKEEGTFVRHADNPVDYGNTLFGKTTHPETKGDLVSDPKGEIIGSLLIPNCSTAKFKVGSREVLLLDITAPNKADASSVGKAIYTAKGTLETRTGTVASSRVLHLIGMEVEKRIVHGQHGDDGPDHIVTTYTVPPGTNFYYSNDAQVTSQFGHDKNFQPSDAADVFTHHGGYGVDDFSQNTGGTIQVDPELNAAFSDFGTTANKAGETTTATVSTSVVESLRTGPGTKADVDIWSGDTNSNDNNDDNSGLSESSGVDNSGGGWT